MARIEKTVFISYRRTDVYTALAVYENLKNQGYDVFFDYRSISSGDFEQIITSNIRARAHFLLILTPTALDRCNEPGDWLRREIEIAIDEKRNIVPLFFKGFRFGTPSVSEKLTGKLKNLSRYNGLNVHEDYFDEAMHRLRTQYLNIPLDTVLHPVSTEVQKVVREEQVAADQALAQIEDVKELVRQAEEKPAQKKEIPKPVAIETVKSEPSSRVSGKTIPWRLVSGLAGGLLLIALGIWGGVSVWNNISTFIPESTRTSQPTATQTSQLVKTNTPSPTKTSIPSTPTLAIGSTMTGKDGMTLLYVAAGKFTMGVKAEDALAECQKFRSDCQLIWLEFDGPPHEVGLKAFWIDQTEVTNEMFAKCVQDGNCNRPAYNTYYDNSSYANHPVVFVTWNDANAYCSWAGRRLPTEAEWEKAASWNPVTNEKFVYPWGNDFDCKKGNFDDEAKLDTYVVPGGENCDGFPRTSPVGSLTAGISPYGLLDMAGNAEEWVSSLFKGYPYDPTDGREDLTNTLLTTSDSRVLRGGSWGGDGYGMRSASRGGTTPTITSGTFGFRCAVSATP